MDTLRAALDALPMPDEPAAYMYPWDLEDFAHKETTATAFSVAVVCPDGHSVPLHTDEAIRAAHRDGARLALERAIELVDGISEYPRDSTKDAVFALRAQLKEMDQ